MPLPKKPATIPPPAQPTPGIRGTLPLPPGQLMERTATGTVRRVKLTDMERRMLIDAGVKPDGPIPKNMAEILQNAREQMSQVQEDAFQEATVNLPLPVSPQ